MSEIFKSKTFWKYSNNNYMYNDLINLCKSYYDFQYYAIQTDKDLYDRLISFIKDISKEDFVFIDTKKKFCVKREMLKYKHSTIEIKNITLIKLILSHTYYVLHGISDFIMKNGCNISDDIYFKYFKNFNIPTESEYDDCCRSNNMIISNVLRSNPKIIHSKKFYLHIYEKSDHLLLYDSAEYLFENCYINLNIIDMFKNKDKEYINFYINPNVDIDVLRKYKDKMDWKIISKKRKMTKEELEEFKSYINKY